MDQQVEEFIKAFNKIIDETKNINCDELSKKALKLAYETEEIELNQSFIDKFCYEVAKENELSCEEVRNIIAFCSNKIRFDNVIYLYNLCGFEYLKTLCKRIVKYNIDYKYINTMISKFKKRNRDKFNNIYKKV